MAIRKIGREVNSPVASEEDSIDVAGVMQQIRSETRARYRRNPRFCVKRVLSPFGRFFSRCRDALKTPVRKALAFLADQIARFQTLRVARLQERLSARQAQEMASLRDDFRKQIEELSSRWEERLAEITREIAAAQDDALERQAQEMASLRESFQKQLEDFSNQLEERLLELGHDRARKP